MLVIGMLKLSEEVIINLIKRGIEIEENNTHILLKLFIAENDKRKRKIIYELLRDSEYHKAILTDCLRTLKGEMPVIPPDKNYGFEEMFATQKMAILRDIKLTIRDFYMYFFEDLRNANLEKILEKDKAEKLISSIEMIIKEKERHLKLIEEMWEF
jgi:hypothetical protein